jgi:hypothetical protein
MSAHRSAVVLQYIMLELSNMDVNSIWLHDQCVDISNKHTAYTQQWTSAYLPTAPDPAISTLYAEPWRKLVWDLIINLRIQSTGLFGGHTCKLVRWLATVANS